MVSQETLWKQIPAHWHRKMTTATEPVGVSKVFLGSPLPFSFKDPCFIGSTVSSSGIGSCRLGSTKWFKDPTLIVRHRKKLPTLTLFSFIRNDERISRKAPKRITNDFLAIIILLSYNLKFCNEYKFSRKNSMSLKKVILCIWNLIVTGHLGQ